MILSCYISPPLNFKIFKTILDNTGINALIASPFKRVHIINNKFLDTMIDNIPIIHMYPIVYINNKWYQYQFIGIEGSIIRFAQYIVSKPIIGKTQIKTIRYIDLVVA